MSVKSDNPPRWASSTYDRIERVRYDEDRELLTVLFQDGSSEEFDPTTLVPTDLKEIDWFRTASNQWEVIVPHLDGWLEIPWDVIRLHTDREFAAHWDAVFAKHESCTLATISEDIGDSTYDK